MIVEVIVPGEPRSKARPRFGQGHAYSTTRQREHEELIQRFLRPHFPAPLPGNVAVDATFYRSTAHRIDLDNLLKLVLDGANRLCWVDDQQVTEIHGHLELDRQNPRTIIRVWPTTSTLVRGADKIEMCRGCGRAYTARKGVAEGYCTVECSRRSRALGVCAVCKAPLARRGALLCQSCWLTKAKKGESKVTLAGNMRVRSPRRGSSQRKGVSFRKDTKKWVAYAQYDGRRITLGNYETEQEAIAAADAFAS